MNTKPISPTNHGVIDYVLSGVQLLAPPLLRLNGNTTKTYLALGLSFLGVNSLTDTRVGLRPAMSVKTHQQIDAGFLVGQALLTFTPYIRKNKKALIFHLAFLALAVTQFMLTDYNEGSSRKSQKQQHP